MSTQQYRVFEWALLDDDGESVYVRNTYASSEQHRIMDERAAALKVVGDIDAHGEVVMPTSTVSSIFQELLSLGILERKVDSERLPSGAGPHVIDAEITGNMQLTSASDELERVLALTARYIPHCRAVNCVVDVPLVSDGFCQWLARLVDVGHAKCTKAGMRTDAIRWAVRARSFADDVLPRLQSLLDAHASVQLSAVDSSESRKSNKEEQLRLKNQVGGLASSGFSVRVELVSRCEPSTLKKALDWREINENAGLIITPLLCEDEYFDDSECLQNNLEFKVAEETLEALSDCLGAGLVNCEPWRSTLAHAILPRQYWSPTTSGDGRVYISPTGLWARSRYHAFSGFHQSPEGLLKPRLHQTQGQRSLEPLGALRTPPCSACGYAAACDKYWSPEGDCLRRTGQYDRASQVGHLWCRLRLRTIALLVQEWRRAASPPKKPQGRAQVEFNNRTVNIRWQGEKK